MLFARVNAERRRQRKPPVEVILVSNREDAGADRTFYLLTGIYHGTFIYSTAVIGPGGRARLLISELEKQEAVQTGLEYVILSHRKNRIKQMLGRGKVVGIHGKRLSFEFAEKLKKYGYELADVTEAITALKETKTPAEMENLRRACAVTADAANALPGWIKPGITEINLAARIDYEMSLRGSEGPSFSTIVAFGRNSAVPHHRSGRARLQKGDLILADFGGRAGQMCADITRVYVLGKASPEQKGLYAHVLRAQRLALARMRARTDGAALSRVVADKINRYRVGKFRGGMNHGLGHSIGVETHDGRAMGREERYLLPKGLALTVEPGYYAPGWGGIRIEDDVVVTKTGILILTEKAYKDTLVEV